MLISLYIFYFHRYHINTAKSILDTILNMQPKEGLQLGGETRETIVARIANDMLNKLPGDYVDHEVSSIIEKISIIKRKN